MTNTTFKLPKDLGVQAVKLLDSHYSRWEKAGTKGVGHKFIQSVVSVKLDSILQKHCQVSAEGLLSYGLAKDG